MKTDKIISGLLALIGFAGCEIIGGQYEYGSPYADFEIKGMVTDEKGDPVRDIKIVVEEKYSDHSGNEVGVGITDAYGHYSVNGGWFGSNLTVAAEDIDGEKNGGEFAAQSRELKIESGDYVGGSGWYEGKVTKTADFTLELQESDESE